MPGSEAEKLTLLVGVAVTNAVVGAVGFLGGVLFGQPPWSWFATFAIIGISFGLGGMFGFYAGVRGAQGPKQ